jgi:HPt (histidine-containing phosphotransfer) domain-containing protein
VILDHAVLDELRAMGGPDNDLLKEVVTEFFADAPQQLHNLRAAFDAGDTGAVERVAHRLKGSALAVGARQLAALCSSVESAARDGDGGRASASAEGLDRELQAARAALERVIG